MPHNSPFRTGVLDALLRESGVPIDGISVVDIDATPPVVNVQYTELATQQQRDLGETIKNGFDWRARRPLDRNTVVTALGQLSAGQITTVIRHMVCDYLRNNPTLAVQVAASQNVALPVDEIDPN